jgi:hypothetical protein
MNFTPGPWRAKRVPHENRLAVEGSGLILVTHTFDGVQAESNINLISAAPDMYEALKKLLVVVKYEGERADTADTSINIYQELINQAKSALCKAGGQT